MISTQSLLVNVFHAQHIMLYHDISCDTILGHIVLYRMICIKQCITLYRTVRLSLFGGPMRNCSVVLKFERGTEAGTDGWSVLVTHPIGGENISLDI